MRSLIALRAHRPTAAVEHLHAQLRTGYPDARIVVVADQLHDAPPQAWPPGYDVVSLTDEVLTSAGLRTDLEDAGWRCGDYAYYALQQALDVDRAWLVEPDVQFLGMDVRAFLDDLDASDADLIATDIRPGDDWFWSYQLTSRGVEEPWRCFFPLTRLSRAAIGASLDLRRRLQWIDGGDFGHPNDEGVVATAVMNAGLTGEDLRLLQPDAFTHFHHRPKLHRDVVAALPDGVHVAHPCLEGGEFAQSVRRECLRAVRDDLRALTSGRSRGPARTVETLGDHALLTDREQALHFHIFGAPDAQYRHYDSGFRGNLLNALPVDVRGVVTIAHLLVRLLAPLAPRDRG